MSVSTHEATATDQVMARRWTFVGKKPVYRRIRSAASGRRYWLSAYILARDYKPDQTLGKTDAFQSVRKNPVVAKVAVSANRLRLASMPP